MPSWVGANGCAVWLAPLIGRCILPGRGGIRNSARFLKTCFQEDLFCFILTAGLGCIKFARGVACAVRRMWFFAGQFPVILGPPRTRVRA